jgi:hypothetical protein
VFGGYLVGAGIVRCRVSRMRVGCSQKGSVRFLFTWRKNYALNSLYQLLADKETAVHECRETMSISIVLGICRLPAS